MNKTILQFINASKPLLAYVRGGTVEAVHRGMVAVVSASGQRLYEIGNIDIPITIRSCTKPFQLVSVLQTGADKKFNLSDSELAVAAASHSAEAIHREAAASVLKKIGAAESDLHCGIHPPINVHSATQLAEAGVAPSQITNNCSGKHASMLAACLANGWDTSDYVQPEHPLQQLNEKNTALFTDTTTPLPVAVDGCTVPTFAIPLFNAALGYARLADPRFAPQGLDGYAERVFTIMNSYPDHGSGSVLRVESRLMRDFPGTLIAKVGAEACFTVGIAPGLLAEEGVGIAIKIEEGINFNRAVDATIVSVLKQLGLIPAEMEAGYQRYLPDAIRDNRGQEIGEVVELFNLQDAVSH